MEQLENEEEKNREGNRSRTVTGGDAEVNVVYLPLDTASLKG